MAKFIKLTAPNGQARYINMDLVQALSVDHFTNAGTGVEGQSTRVYSAVLEPDGETSWWEVTETPDEILALIKEAG